MGAWIKRREVVTGARRIRSDKLREHQYMEGYTKCLGSKGVGGNEEQWLTVQEGFMAQ